MLLGYVINPGLTMLLLKLTLTLSFLDRLTAKGLMEYLMCEENNILDVVHLDQDNDMNQPMNHYLVNSSHNTYLTGT